MGVRRQYKSTQWRRRQVGMNRRRVKNGLNTVSGGYQRKQLTGKWMRHEVLEEESTEKRQLWRRLLHQKRATVRCQYEPMMGRWIRYRARMNMMRMTLVACYRLSELRKKGVAKRVIQQGQGRSKRINGKNPLWKIGRLSSDKLYQIISESFTRCQFMRPFGQAFPTWRVLS